MIEANKRLFSNLDRFCSNRSDEIRNAGKARFLATGDGDKAFLKEAKSITQISLSTSVKLAHYRFQDRSFLIASGLEVTEPPKMLDEEDLGAGALTLFLSEHDPTPQASTTHIRNIVERDDRDSNPEFLGFEVQQIAPLFPPVQVFSTPQLDGDESHKTFFLLTLGSKPVLHLRNENTIKTIRSLAELSSQAIPYETLCRSVLDCDPSSIFLALYRCLEALYAYSHTEALRKKLNLTVPWPELASTLEEVLDWRPREEPSLIRLFEHATGENLKRVADSLGAHTPKGTTLSTYVAKRVYNLRNSAVHYRPFQQISSNPAPDWDRIVEALAILIFQIYDQVSVA